MTGQEREGRREREKERQGKNEVVREIGREEIGK